MKNNLFALFIGIDAYNESVIFQDGVYFPALQGCKNDVHRMQKFLESDATLQVHATVLTDAQATKSAVCAAFQTDLAKAKSGDSILVYYSGHGSIEVADSTVWTSESDKRLESLVCYYDAYAPGGHGAFLLADKELRLLLHELYQKTQAHITLIFDCCHSGDSVRSMAAELDATKAASKPIARKLRGNYTFPKRQWSDFVFATTFTEADIRTRGFENTFPEGRFVHFSAAESNEPALEENGAGVFSTALLAALGACGNQIEAGKLHGQAANRLRFAYSQRPKLYTPKGADDLRKTGFLGKKTGLAAQNCTITYNPSEGFLLDKGQMHGVVAGKSTVEVLLPSGKTEIGAVESVGLSFAKVAFEYSAALVLHEKQFLSATLLDAEMRLLKVFFAKKGGNDALAQALLQKLDSPVYKNKLEIAETEAEADYVVWMAEGLGWISRPGDPYRPLAKVALQSNPRFVDHLAEDLAHIAHWEHWSRFHNAQFDALPATALKVEFFLQAAGGIRSSFPVAPDGAAAVLSYQKRSDGTQGIGIAARLTNTTASDLYVGLAFMEYDFSSAIDLLVDQVTLLEPGASCWICEKEGQVLRLSMEKMGIYYNWASMVSSFKFIFSTTPFDVSPLEMSRLQAPATAITRSATRGSRESANERGISPKTWGTARYDLAFSNPFHNQVPMSVIQEMIPQELGAAQWEMTYFGLGLYTDVDLKGKRVLKKELIATEKSIISDAILNLANRWANFNRNRQCDVVSRQLPDAPRVVSEGDSWFQHPLLNDIIDQVGVFYPTFCLAAAGDTIANYIKTGEFLKEIKRIQPKYFLLSGGGNDILGESMRKFLKPAPAATKATDYFSDALPVAVQTLLDLYKTTFLILATQAPGVQILIHGYDYPRPIAPGSDARSWMGKYFDEVSMTDTKIRSEASHYLIDTFNGELSKLVAQFQGQVHHLDLRGVVPDDEWDDEIHPNNAGYQKVALRFIWKIAELEKASQMGR